MRFLNLIALTALVVTAACNGNKSSNKGDSQTAEDSVTTATEAAREVKPLPDTVLPSAENVKFSVETVNTEVSGKLCSLTDLYAETPGAFTFRKGSMRQADFGGHVQGTPSEIVVDWEFHTESSPTWGSATGWTGQPLYVEWPDSMVTAFRQAGVVNENFSPKEIIVGSLAGYVYFINFETGKRSRTAVDVFNPIKGTLSLDPTLNGNLYVGQGIAQHRPFGSLVVDLFDNKVTDTFGEDPKAGRHWGAYDSSPVRVGQFLFRPGENGTLYKFTVSRGKQKLHSALRYTVKGSAPGMEASMGVYANYGFVADNAGNILGVNLDTMKPVWYYDLGDDTDASLVVCVEKGHPYIYVGCEIDKQNVGTGNFVKLDAVNGSEIWKLKVPGRLATVGEKHFDGGFYATALPGLGNCEDLLFVNVVYNEKGQNGAFMAIKKESGEIAYTSPLARYSWSSPVGFLNEKNEYFVATGDGAGNMYVFNGRDGKELVRKNIAHNFESSPVVVGNSLVVGSRGSCIFKMTIK